MLFILSLILIQCPRWSKTEQVQCHNDITKCETADSQSVVNNKYYCCDVGFSMQWVKNNITGQKDCVCDRYYYVSDCLEGRSACQGATSMSSDGANIKCCRHGAKMSIVSNTVFNGVLQNYCRCMQYMNIANSKAPSHQNSMAEAMQEMQMLGAMGLLPEEMYASVNQMSRIMSPASAPSAFSDPLITSFVEGVVQGIVKAIGDVNNSTNPSRSVSRRRNRRPYNNNQMVYSQPYIPPTNYILPAAQIPQQSQNGQNSVVTNSNPPKLVNSGADVNPLYSSVNPYSNIRSSQRNIYTGKR
uniref:Uncharacterized protein n=1 Tax=Biomphalaria glabrata TaxID=6526 RepID=A0A2C9KH29_BIOGL